jgi:hypothetical protein
MNRYSITGPTSLAFLLAITTLLPLSVKAADLKWWHTSSPNAAPNGQIVLKNGSGAARTLAANPTGASLSKRTANTQPPTVIVQATATLPVVTINTPCDSTVDTAGISADRKIVLTCQANVWKADPAVTTLQVNGVVTEGSACTPNGLVGRDGTGLILSCQSGIWIAGRYGGPYLVQNVRTEGVWASYCYTLNPYSGGCSCPGGYTPSMTSYGTEFESSGSVQSFVGFDCRR